MRWATIFRRAAAAAAGLSVSAAVILYGFTQRALIRNDAVAAARLNPISSEALSEAAVSALIAGDEARAEALARAAVRRSPFTPLAFSTLAFIRDSEKRELEAAALMAAAAKLSWADEAAQLWMIRRAVDEDKLEEAVDRSDALLRQRRVRDEIFTFLRGLSNEPVALEAIAERLAAGPPWRYDFLTQLAAIGPESYAGHEQILLRLKRSAAPPTEDEINAYLSRLIGEQRHSDARAAWMRLGGAGAGGGLVGDANFERLAGPDRRSPFEWTVHRMPGLSIGGGREGLRLAAEGRPSGRALEQIVVLAPGTYLLAIEAREARVGSLQSLHWELTCLGGNGRPEVVLRPSPQPKRAWQRIERVVTIPAGACPAQRLELRIDHDEARDLDVRVQKISIEPLLGASREGS